MGHQDPAPTADPPADSRHLGRAMLRGATHRCPACGKGKLYHAYLKVADACPACRESLHHQRTDDAPPYLTILLVGHVVVASVLAVDLTYAWPIWLTIAVWFPVTILMSMAFLPIAKGALVGLQWALRMHGFGGADDGVESHPTLEPQRSDVFAQSR